jgi:hypothetical protein
MLMQIPNQLPNLHPIQQTGALYVCKPQAALLEKMPTFAPEDFHNKAHTLACGPGVR